MASVDMLERGREAFERRAWAEAYTLLLDADRETALEPQDLERSATAAYLTGLDIEGDSLWARAHTGFLEGGDLERAVRCAFWLALGLLSRGDRSRAGGWIARASRILEEARRECAEAGYLLLPSAIRCVYEGNLQQAYDSFSAAAALGGRFGDRALVAFARHGEGRTLMRMGKIEEGMALLDEAMAAIEAGEVPPLMTGDIYCSVIEACHECFDVRRAQEWTSALSRWCDSQTDLVPYRGQCLIHRSEMLQLRGEWGHAGEEAERACEWLLRPPPRRAAGPAFYQRGELHRLRGEFAAAEGAYRKASEWGRTPEPGLALLRLAQGKTDAAVASIQRALDEARARVTRSRLLPPFVEIALAAHDAEGARRAADELQELAEVIGASVLRAVANQARGAVLLAEGDASGALTLLRDAAAIWREFDAPYELARVRVLIADACRAMGDDDDAEMELDSARSAFRRLGAVPDLARAEQISRGSGPPTPGGLSPRELQVIRLIAAGMSNRAIATELFISERTVDRHVSNIFTKLGMSSRAAATAYAYEHGIV